MSEIKLRNLIDAIVAHDDGSYALSSFRDDDKILTNKQAETVLEALEYACDTSNYVHGSDYEDTKLYDKAIAIFCGEENKTRIMVMADNNSEIRRLRRNEKIMRKALEEIASLDKWENETWSALHEANKALEEIKKLKTSANCLGIKLPKE